MKNIVKLKSSESLSTWRNCDNKDFYEKIAPEQLINFTNIGGLSTCCDIKILLPYLEKAGSILEVGAGYGRVINELLHEELKAKITAIERSKSLFNHVKEKYGDSITLFNIDIFDCEIIKQKFDVILSLWSGMADFSFEEQPIIIEKLSKLLNKDGKLILDTMPQSTIPFGMKENIAQNYEQVVNSTTVHTYSMSNYELEEYAKKSGFTKVTHLPYTTDSQRKRILHVLS